MEEIIWKQINGYEGRYWISNNGGVRSSIKLFSVKPHAQKGYVQVSLWDAKLKKRISVGVHRLVSEYFLDPVQGKTFTNHKNGIKSDNRVENLEWSTLSENTLHAYKYGLIKPTYGAAKLTLEDVIGIKKLMQYGMSMKSISRLYNITTTQLTSVKKRTWNVLKKCYRIR